MTPVAVRLILCLVFRLLHRAVDEGKRALVYVIAKKMADLKRLESKDHAGKVKNQNQHTFMFVYLFVYVIFLNF